MTLDFPHYFEDFPVGREFCSGEEEITREEIRSFASRFDPQRHHLDEAFAETTIFHGLSASGWHTAAITMRLMVQCCIGPESGNAGAGVDELRWHRPVRPGDRLHVKMKVIEAHVSKSKPTRGVVRIKTTTFNQNDEIVQTSYSSMVANRRPADPAEAQG